LEEVNSKFGDYSNFNLKQNEALLMDTYLMPLIIAKSGFKDSKVLEETFLSTAEGYCLILGHPLNEAINEIISVLIETGIINHWISETYHQLKAKHFLDLETGPQVLTLNHLFIGFVIWLIALAFAVVVFVIEIIFQCWKRRSNVTRVLPFAN